MKLLNSQNIGDFLESGGLNSETDLCRIIKESGSDKCSGWHNYSPLYHFIFSENKSDFLNLFEVGIYGGGSVRAWKKYFQNSMIFCGDVNRDYFIDEERVKSFYCDQDNPHSINKMWEDQDLINVEFDVIIDDGKHEFQPNLSFLASSYYKLKPNGFFIIEDLTIKTMDLFKSKLEEIKDSLNPSYMEILEIPYPPNTIDNNIILIQK